MEKVSINSCIENTIDSIKRSYDYSDLDTTAQFMVLIDSVISNPKELTTLSNRELADLGICMSCIMTSGFVDKYPNYNEWSTGKIVGTVGLYAFIKQLNNSYLLCSHYPSFVVLMHDGREYISDLLQDAILFKRQINMYNIFDVSDFYDTEQKKYDIVKCFEYALHLMCRKTGNSDENLDVWCNEIECELNAIERRVHVQDSIEHVKSLYKNITSNFVDDKMPKYCMRDE